MKYIWYSRAARVAQWFGAAFGPGHDPGVPGSSPMSGSLHGACFSLCLCLCLSFSWINKKKNLKKKREYKTCLLQRKCFVSQLWWWVHEPTYATHCTELTHKPAHAKPGKCAYKNSAVEGQYPGCDLIAYFAKSYHWNAHGVITVRDYRFSQSCLWGPGDLGWGERTMASWKLHLEDW